MKPIIPLVTFIAGVMVGAAALAGYWLWAHQTTEVWVAKRSVQAGQGIRIPAGTELTLERWMPEGFAALSLGINVEGEALDDFDRRTEQRSFLRIPYAIDAREE